MLIFLVYSNTELSTFFSGEKWLVKLACLAEIFFHLNILNFSLQGLNALYAQDRVNAFVKNLRLWNKRVA